MSSIQSLRQQAIRSRDPNEITSYLGRVYGANVHLRPLKHRHGDRLALVHHRTAGNGFALEDVRHDGNVETRAEGTSGVMAVWPLAGQVESHLHDDGRAARQGDVVLGSTAVFPVRMRTCDATMKTVVVERALLIKAAADLSPECPASVRFTGLDPVTPQAARALTAARRYVEGTVLADDSLAGPLILAAAGRLLAATVLSAFPNSAGLVDGRHDRNDSQPVLLRRATAYIDEHVAEDIGIADVARAVYVTPRALQYMFRRHLDSTPMAYLRRARLDHVHRELIAADRGSTTVTATAARWGFAHTGRFAVLYRETYGHSPHVTLRY